MNHKYWICTFALACLTLTSFAQKKKAHILSLTFIDEHRLEIPNRKYHVAKVIDARPDTSAQIGTIIKGQFGKERPLYLAKGLSKTAEDYIKFLELDVPLMEGSIPVEVHIVGVDFSEKLVSAGEIAKASIDIDFVVQGSVIYSSTKKTSSPSGLNVTPYLDRLFMYCVFSNLNTFNLLADREIPAYHSDTSDTTIRILTEDLKPGFYASFNDFVNNRPVFDFEFYVENYESKSYRKKGHTKDLNLVIVDPRFDMDRTYFLNSIYGFCDGEKFYLKERIRGNPFGFSEIKPKNGRFVMFKGLDKVVIPVPTVVFIAMYIFDKLPKEPLGVLSDFVFDQKTGSTHYIEQNSYFDRFMKENFARYDLFERQSEAKYYKKAHWIDLVNSMSE